MELSLINLETRMFYRFIKVIYVFLLVLMFLIVLCFGWQTKPYQIIDAKKSYLTCPDGTKFSFKSLDISFYSAKRDYSSYDARKVIKACNKHLKSVDSRLESSDSNWEVALNDLYPTHWEEETIGSWFDVIKFWLIVAFQSLF